MIDRCIVDLGSLLWIGHQWLGSGTLAASGVVFQVGWSRSRDIFNAGCVQAGLGTGLVEQLKPQCAINPLSVVLSYRTTGPTLTNRFGKNQPGCCISWHPSGAVNATHQCAHGGL
jgi:hypothetical protein